MATGAVSQSLGVKPEILGAGTLPGGARGLSSAAPIRNRRTANQLRFGMPVALGSGMRTTNEIERRWRWGERHLTHSRPADTGRTTESSSRETES